MPKTDETPEKARKSLDERLEAVETARARANAPGGGDAHTAAAMGYRFVGEVVGGVLGGVGLGWFFDRLAGTSPLGLICGLLIGSGISIFVAVKSAAKASRTQMERMGPLPSVPDDEDED